MSTKPSIPKGTRDFSPAELVKRNYIFDTIEAVFKKYAYQKIETPSMENYATLMGKYGEEGDRLIFKILNSGDFLSKASSTNLDSKNSISITKEICEKALRYDLTVPFARYVVQHQNDISFPFKRYQIQPVWRADRPQKGRYREFYQCDVDAIGSTSLLNEIELIQITKEIFDLLKINTTIKINNRKILAGIAESINELDNIIAITVALDKFDKIGKDGVIKELEAKGIEQKAIQQLIPIFNFTGTNESKIEKLKKLIDNSEIGMQGIAEIEEIFHIIKKTNLPIANLELDITLARGLNYYTGAIFEVVTTDFPSSICGGGRYDDLTGVFGLKNMSGVGVSFGADRIYDVMKDLNLFPASIDNSIDYLFLNFGTEEGLFSLELVTKLREKGINTELYPDATKMKKQMKYAHERNVKNVVMIGSNEMEANRIVVKEMATGEQQNLAVNEFLNTILN